MKITLLGTGTSQGIPVIGCDCETCTSSDVKDIRMRCSVLIESKDFNVIIDVGPDFRAQMLAHKVHRLDAVLLTHEHNDHVIGLDDIRPLNFKHKMLMPLYGLQRVIDDIKVKFAYVFEDGGYPGKPRVICHPIYKGEVLRFGSELVVEALAVKHGSLDILGYRVGDFTYITDASYLTEDTYARLVGLKVLVLNALQYRPHYSHFTVDQAIAVAQRIGAEHTYFTHLSHYLPRHSSFAATLPVGISPAYDGLQFLM